MIEPWTTDRTEWLGDYRIFKLRREHRTSPRNGSRHDFYVLECPDWVNVVALTPERRIVLVEQFRHGTNTVDLEIPGGVMDRADASPVETAMRELSEETGYEGRDARVIGTVAANPAIMNNTCHTILIEDCILQGEPRLDHGEDLITRLADLDELPGFVGSGRMPHSLVVAALYHLDQWRKGAATRR